MIYRLMKISPPNRFYEDFTDINDLKEKLKEYKLPALMASKNILSQEKRMTCGGYKVFVIEN